MNTCFALLALKISMTSAASNLLEKIKSDPDLSQVNIFNRAKHDYTTIVLFQKKKTMFINDMN